MQNTEKSLSLFSSEIAPMAWQQLIHLPQETYLALLARVRMLAGLASLGWHPPRMPGSGDGLETSLSFRWGDLAALYEVDLQARVVRLLEVARRLPTAAVTEHAHVG